MTQKISLDWQEVTLASGIGLRRRINSMKDGKGERAGAYRKNLAEQMYANIIGACGEMALAKLLGIYWPGKINQPKGEPDLPPDIQVRTLALPTYDLIVRDDDRNDQKFYLVTGEIPEFEVHGWCWGGEAKQPVWRSDPGGHGAPCFLVPRGALEEISGGWK